MRIPKTKNGLTYKLLKLSGKDPPELKAPKSSKQYVSSVRDGIFESKLS